MHGRKMGAFTTAPAARVQASPRVPQQAHRGAPPRPSRGVLSRRVPSAGWAGLVASPSASAAAPPRGFVLASTASDSASGVTPSGGAAGEGDRILIAVDRSDNAYEGVSWTADNLCRPGDVLEAVFVLCDKRPTSTAVGASSSGRVMQANVDADFLRPKMLAHFKAEAEEAKLGIECQMGQLLGEQTAGKVEVKMVKETKSAAVIGQAIVEEANKVDPKALVIVSQGFGLLAEYGSVSRYCCHNYRRPMVLVPPSVMSKADLAEDQVVVAANTKEEVLKLLRWVADNAACPETCTFCVLTVMHPEELSLTMDDVPADLVSDLNSQGLAQIHLLPMAGVEVNEASSDEYDARYGTEVCAKVEELRPRFALTVSYAGQGMLREMMYGSMAMYCSKHCTSPLVLLQPDEA